MSNSMILTIPVKPEKRDEFVTIMKTALVDTRAYDGCVGVDMFTPEDDAGKVMLLEVWETKGHQEKYFAWRIESGMMDQMADFFTGEPSITWLAAHDF